MKLTHAVSCFDIEIKEAIVWLDPVLISCSIFRLM